MAAPHPGYSMVLRMEAPATFNSTSEITTAAAAAGAQVTALDIVESFPNSVVVDIRCNVYNAEHRDEVRDALNALDGVKVHKISDRTFLIHLGGKIEVTPRVSLRNRDDLSRAYTPGVARVCIPVRESPKDARRLTVKRNTVAVVTGVSAPNVLDGNDIATMADDAIVFAMANPEPEVHPRGRCRARDRSGYRSAGLPEPDQQRAGLPRAAGRGRLRDHLRGARGRRVAIADCVHEDERNASFIVPSVFDQNVAPAAAEAVKSVAEASRAG